MLLAQSHTMRNRYEEAEAALAAVEPLAPTDANARDYLRQRLSLHHWGLRLTERNQRAARPRATRGREDA